MTPGDLPPGQRRADDASPPPESGKEGLPSRVSAQEARPDAAGSSATRSAKPASPAGSADSAGPAGSADSAGPAGPAGLADPTGSAGSAGSGPGPGSADAGLARRRLGAEIWIVLGLSLGQSAVYSIISLSAKLTAGRSLAQQTSTLNASRATREYVDLAYQLAGIVFTLVPVALALWLLSEGGRSAVRRLGLDARQPWRDLAFGAGLAAVIGLPGLGLYFIGRALDITTTIVPAALNTHWWTVPVLILAALKNALLEEVIVVGYLMTRLDELGWPAWAQTGVSAVLRGAYHLYQGFGPFLGNVIMGVIFAEWFRRKRRVMPLVVAHTILDIVAFVGYELVGEALGLK